MMSAKVYAILLSSKGEFKNDDDWYDDHNTTGQH